jgi:hypothetical protein
MRVVAALGVFLALLGARSQAQDSAPAPAPSPKPQTKHSGAPLGQFTAGPFIITPTFQIGSLAVDTNVQYQRERRADFVASGGPGLDIALPFHDHWMLDIQGSSQYFYFHRTKDLRRWTGGGAVTLLWATTGTRASLSTTGSRDFSRPNFEVDTRVVSTQNNVSGTIERDLGRLTLVARAVLNRTKLDKGQEFRGADLTTALTTNRLAAAPELRYRLTPLSSLLVEGGYEATRFPNAQTRNFHQESVGLGILTTGLLKGQVTAGIRWNKLSGGGASKNQPYLRGSLSQQAGRRLTLRESYTQESAVSAFAVDGSLPTFERRGLSLDISILLTSRVDLRLGGTYETVKSDGLVNVILDDGTKATALRDDVAYIGRADLGIRLGRARLGLFTTYTTRESLFFSDFGIDGLQAGARVEYSPR